MTPQDQEQFNQLKQEVSDLMALLTKDRYSNLEVFRKKVLFNSDVTLGTSIGVTPTKLGFYTKYSAPIVQQTTFTAPTGGEVQDAEARTAIGAIKTILTNVGITT